MVQNMEDIVREFGTSTALSSIHRHGVGLNAYPLPTNPLTKREAPVKK